MPARDYLGSRTGCPCSGGPSRIRSFSLFQLILLVLFTLAKCDQQSEQKVQQWCGQRFNTDRKSCFDFLDRWCSPQKDINLNKDLIGICDVYRSSGLQNFSILLPEKDVQNRSGDQRRRLERQSTRGNGVKKAQKADPSILNNLKQLFNKLAQAENHLITTFSDPIRTLASPPKQRKNSKSKPTVTELSRNDPSKYFHGDVDLTPSQANSLIEWAKAHDPVNQPIFQKSGQGRRKRKVGAPPAFELWSINPIPYYFDTSVPTPTRDIIRKAIKMWESNTCRRWVEGGRGEDRLLFVNGDGCSSFIGFAGGTQEIDLETPGCDEPGIAAHEIGHSLGFFHEQSRPDQSDNVKVNYKNIRWFVTDNFTPMKQEEVNYYNEPYDFGSVMHYDGLTRGFTRDEDEYSIITLDPNYQNTIGQRIEPSFVDIKQINAAYCASTCGSMNPNGCEHGGYADPNSCTKCKCPTGFGGAKCETVAKSTIANCGGVLQATKSPQFFTSPNYPHAYPLNGDCDWMLKAPNSNSKVYIEFVETFAFPCEETCMRSFVEIKRGSKFDRTGYRFCCDSPPDHQPLVSDGPLMIVHLHTFGPAASGFKIRYYTDAGAGTVPPPIATRKPGGTTRKPLPPEQRSTARPGVTPAPGPAPTDPPGCNCGQWGEWSGCSQNCGGCGYIRRQRKCSNEECFDIEKRHCNFEQCTDGSTFMWNNNEFYLLFGGCCIGMVASGGVCGGLGTAFSQLVSSFIPRGRR